VTFFVTSTVELYKVQSTSKVIYRITQVIPFPVAKAGSHFVSYENYLFELRRYMYYYQTQQQVDFSTDSGKRQLETYKPKAMQRVIQDAYVKELADEHDITVSSSEVADAVSLLRAQNMLTKRFYDWSLRDLERELRQELLAQKVAAALDTDAIKKADDVVKQAQNGADFAQLASQYSDDIATKGNGGVYADTAITTGSQTVDPVIVRELPKMKPGEVSRIITTPTAFEIVKLLEVSADKKYKVAHIQINFKSIDAFTKPIADKTKVHHFIKIDLNAASTDTP
jgi:parvulin-like peptidyl-prolyl isomerase